MSTNHNAMDWQPSNTVTNLHLPAPTFTPPAPIFTPPAPTFTPPAPSFTPPAPTLSRSPPTLSRSPPTRIHPLPTRTHPLPTRTRVVLNRALSSGTKGRAPHARSWPSRAEGGSVRASHTAVADRCSVSFGADSPAACPATMQRTGARSEEPTAGTSRPTQPDTLERLYATLNEYLLLEHKYQPRLCLPNESENGEVTTGARDGAAHVLRCLKVWFDLPADVLIDAINLFDRFLTKMKVRPCHVPCITVSCMNLAIDLHHQQANTTRTVSIEELVSVSQSACTGGDVSRMSAVIADKLGLSPQQRPISPYSWLKLFRQLVATVAELQQLSLVLTESELVNLLEIAVCDAVCANARLSELALVLLYYKLEQQMVSWSSSGGAVPDNAYCLFDFGAQLQAHCRMSDSSLVLCRNRVRWVMSRYEARCAAPQRQRLVWKLSSRTLKVLRPTDRLTSLLPTIEEQHLANEASPVRNRSGSESSESEDMSDWPRSPLLPVLCDN